MSEKPVGEEPVIRKQRCLRCQHGWYPQRVRPPKRCPKCMSPYWDRPRERPMKP